MDQQRMIDVPLYSSFFALFLPLPLHRFRFRQHETILPPLLPTVLPPIISLFQNTIASCGHEEGKD